MERSISQSISFQIGGVCYAHSAARVILKAIKNIIPDRFYPMVEWDSCDSIFTANIVDEMFKVTLTDSCSIQGRNNLLMFNYLLVVITNQFPCDTDIDSQIIFEWVFTQIKTETIYQRDTYIELFRGFEMFSDEKYQIILDLFKEFHDKFYIVEQNEMNVFRSKLGRQSIDIIKFVIDHSHYVFMYSRPINGKMVGHAVTIVGYEQDELEPNNPYMIIKNSWGFTDTESEYFSSRHVRGIVKQKFEDLIINWIAYSYVFPQKIEESFNKGHEFRGIHEFDRVQKMEKVRENERRDTERRQIAKSKLENCSTDRECKLFGEDGYCHNTKCYFPYKGGSIKRKKYKNKSNKNKNKKYKNKNKNKNKSNKNK